MKIINLPYRSVISLMATILSRNLITVGVAYGCLAARDEHIIVYFHHFGQDTNVTIDACCNKIFVHILVSVVGIKDLFHEVIRNIDNSYHVVESDSLYSKWIAMVKDGALDIIYHRVLRT